MVLVTWLSNQSDFKNGSSDAHLSLAVMIENLFKFAATISFGTLKRLEEKLEEATKVRFQALSLA